MLWLRRQEGAAVFYLDGREALADKVKSFGGAALVHDRLGIILHVKRFAVCVNIRHNAVQRAAHVLYMALGTFSHGD